MKLYLVIPLQKNGAEHAFLTTEKEIHLVTPHPEFPIDSELRPGIIELWHHYGKKLLRQLGRLP